MSTLVESGRRPLVVTVACGMLAGGGALFAAEVLLSGADYFTNMRTYERAVHDNLIENDTAFAGVGVALHWGMTAIGVFAGVALVALAGLALFRQSWARAVSWLFGIPILLWYGGLAVLHFLAAALVGDVRITQSAELTRRYDEAWPPWLDTLDTGLMVAVAVLLTAALVGQTLPAADAYFKGRSR